MSQSENNNNKPKVEKKQQQSKEVENLMSQVLTTLGYDLKNESFRETPKRFAKYMQEFSPEKDEPDFTVFPTDNVNAVVISGLEIRSMCAHHLAPFFGKCTIAYYPRKKIAGLSKFQRVLDYLCKQPTEQETLNEKVMRYLDKKLEPLAIVVIMEAQHTCMIVRGVGISGSQTKTVATRGAGEDIDGLLTSIKI